jgi:hypothetical protein
MYPSNFEDREIDKTPNEISEDLHPAIAYVISYGPMNADQILKSKYGAAVDVFLVP